MGSPRHIHSRKERLQTDERRERFEQLYAEHLHRVLGYALRRTDPEEARDVVAETFAIAWRRLDDVPDHAIPWLLGTARRVLANRRRKHHELPAAPAAIVPDHAEAVVGLATLVAAFNRLTDADRETLGLIAWDGLEPREAARVVGCSSATFAVRLHRARRRLEALLEKPASMTEERT